MPSLPQEFWGWKQGLQAGFRLQKLTPQLPHPLSRITGGGERKRRFEECDCLPGRRPWMLARLEAQRLGDRGADDRNPLGGAEDMSVQVRQSSHPNPIMFLFERRFVHLKFKGKIWTKGRLFHPLSQYLLEHVACRALTRRGKKPWTKLAKVLRRWQGTHSESDGGHASTITSSSDTTKTSRVFLFPTSLG